MRAPHLTPPIELHLPGGVRLSWPYDIDVSVPEDLAGWFWFGTFLSDGQVGIYSGTFGVPGVFEQARELRRLAVRPLETMEMHAQQLSLWEVAA